MARTSPRRVSLPTADDLFRRTGGEDAVLESRYSEIFAVLFEQSQIIDRQFFFAVYQGRTLYREECRCVSRTKPKRMSVNRRLVSLTDTSDGGDIASNSRRRPVDIIMVTQEARRDR